MEGTVLRVEGAPVALVGDKVCDREYLKGYNTYFEGEGGDGIIAATCGVVEVVEKVVSVRGLHPRYLAEIGDVVVGRITEVSGNRWKCSIGSPNDAVMLLSNITEPGGVLRRRGRDDELTMRNIFGEGDIVVAEVQRLLGDGIVSLHTRSAEKFGKVPSAGVLVSVNPSLIRRCKSHFHVFADQGVSMVLGMNGKIWLSLSDSHSTAGWAGMMNEAQQSSTTTEDNTNSNNNAKSAGAAATTVDFTTDARSNLARIRNCLIVLDKSKLSIHPFVIENCLAALGEAGLSSRDTLNKPARNIIYNAAVAARVELTGKIAVATKRNRED